MNIAFYDIHQVEIDSNVIEFNRSVLIQNVSIPEELSYSGGYFRIAYINDSVTSKTFQEILPWLSQQGNGNNGVSVSNSISENETQNETQNDIGILEDNTNNGFQGEYFLASVGITGLLAGNTKRVKRVFK